MENRETKGTTKKIPIETTETAQQSDAMKDKSPHSVEKSSKKRVFVFLSVALMLLVPAIIFYWYYISSYHPKKIANEYLKAIQLHDFSTITKLSGISNYQRLLQMY